jgi:hypothetical protein
MDVFQTYIKKTQPNCQSTIKKYILIVETSSPEPTYNLMNVISKLLVSSVAQCSLLIVDDVYLEKSSLAGHHTTYHWKLGLPVSYNSISICYLDYIDSRDAHFGKEKLDIGMLIQLLYGVLVPLVQCKIEGMDVMACPSNVFLIFYHLFVGLFLAYKYYYTYMCYVATQLVRNFYA